VGSAAIISDPKHIISPEEPAAQGPHQKAGAKHARRLQQLPGRVDRGEEGRSKIYGAKGIDVEIEPFDQIAARRRDDGANAAIAVFGAIVRRKIGYTIVTGQHIVYKAQHQPDFLRAQVKLSASSVLPCPL
jgi:hypothetical protein